MTATFPPLLQKPYSLLHVNGTIESVVKTEKPPISKVTIHFTTRLEQNWGWQRSYYNCAPMIGTKRVPRCSRAIPLHQGLTSYSASIGSKLSCWLKCTCQQVLHAGTMEAFTYLFNLLVTLSSLTCAWIIPAPACHIDSLPSPLYQATRDAIYYPLS